MKNTILVLFVALSLSGCFYQTVNQRDLNKAIAYCGSIKNVSEISSIFSGDERVECFDKPSTYLGKVKGTTN